LDLFQGHLQDLLVEKQQRRERLVLGRGADVAIDGQVGQEPVDLGGPISAGWRTPWKRMKRRIQPT
jgi:hypothetical protein